MRDGRDARRLAGGPIGRRKGDEGGPQSGAVFSQAPARARRSAGVAHGTKQPGHPVCCSRNVGPAAHHQ